MIYKYFYNQDEQRLTAGIRLLFQFALFVSAFIITVAISNRVENYYLSNLTQEFLLIPFAFLTLVFPIIFFDKRRISNLGFSISKKWFIDLLYGLGLGALLMLFVFAILIFTDRIEIAQFFYSEINYSFLLEILGRFLGYLSIGLIEESFARGYHIKNISEGLNKNSGGNRNSVIIAWVISSLIFGILHGANPNSSLIGIVNLFLIGFFYGYTYVISGSLAIPIGLHTAWNFFQGNVFGFNVSGFKPEVTFILSSNLNNDLLSGGDFGPESGLIMIPTLILGFILSYYILKYRNKNTSINSELAVYKKS